MHTHKIAAREIAREVYEQLRFYRVDGNVARSSHDSWSSVTVTLKAPSPATLRAVRRYCHALRAACEAEIRNAPFVVEPVYCDALMMAAKHQFGRLFGTALGVGATRAAAEAILVTTDPAEVFWQSRGSKTIGEDRPNE